MVRERCLAEAADNLDRSASLKLEHGLNPSPSCLPARHLSTRRRLVCRWEVRADQDHLILQVMGGRRRPVEALASIRLQVNLLHRH